MSAPSSFSPDLYVRSNTDPEIMFFIFTTVEGVPLPGLRKSTLTTM